MNKIFDKINKSPLWKKLGIFCLFSVFILFFFYWTQWRSLDQQFAQLKERYHQLERTYLEQKVVAEDLATFKKKTIELEEKLRVALIQLPKQKEIPSLLRDIYTEGQKSGIEFNSFQPQSDQQKALYAEVPIKLQLTGSYHKIGVFLDRIGKLSRIVNISDLELSGTKGLEGETILKTNCTLTTFMFLGSGS